MLGDANQKDLFDYWHDRVQIRNLDLIASKQHVPTQVLRHECTNYDYLRRLPAVLALDDLERCRIIAIIKYEWGCPNSMDRPHAAISINLARCR